MHTPIWVSRVYVQCSLNNNTDISLAGRHCIRYAILPHAGPLDHRTVRTARNFNHPMKIYSQPTDSVSLLTSLFSSIRLTGSPSLVLDIMKRGEDDEDVSRRELPCREGRSIILRVYESLGGKARGAIKTSLRVKKVYKTNALEDDESEIKVEAGEAKIELRGFEVATYRLQL